MDVLKVAITRATTRHGEFSLRVSKANMQRASDLIHALPPSVRRDKVKQMAALQAENVYDMALKFSRDSLEHMPLEERISTIIHEAAHLVDFMRNGRGAGDGHGPTWAALMIEAGEKPTKTAAGAETMRAHAKCDCQSHVVEAITAADIMARASLGMPAVYRCPACKSSLRDVEPPVAQDARRRFDMAFRKKKAELQATKNKRALAESMSLAALGVSAADIAAARTRDQYARQYNSALYALERAAEALAQAGDHAGALATYRKGLAKFPSEALNAMDTGEGAVIWHIRRRIKQLAAL